ncbi:dihydrolipoamide acetyltransferase family protein [Streptomyces cacaoi]|uniref:dihydrolipoamide acetyltransferase family protein n=1 Tax=Streptomyces cacaoi TaxID=1898 RepID=UPI0026212DEA|nr:dihydrolipoamide acetyltransferase family protein [Streptomyces cacaoi]
MAEVREFALPDLGEGLTEATVVRWLVGVGEAIEIDQPVVEVETAKALVEVPCPYGGVVTAHQAQEGAEIPVGAPLVTVATGARADEAASGGLRGAEASGGAGAPEPTVPELEHVGGSGNVLVGYGTSPAARRRPRISRPLPGTPAGPGTGRDAPAGPPPRVPEVNGSGAPAGHGVPTTGPGAPDGPARPAVGAGVPHADGTPVRRGPVAVISPLVRRLAREHDIDLATLDGTGPDGLILRADVERAVRQPQAATERGTDTTGAQADGDGARRIPLRGLRATAAERLTRSRREIPDASCWVDADATELLALKRRMNAPLTHSAPTRSIGSPGAAEGGRERKPVSLLALLARICTAALSRFPELNAFVDTDAREIVLLPQVHLGFAAQTDRGLVVPVVHEAHTLDAEQLTERTAQLTEAARAGTLTPGQLTGGTFTLNNYGVFGVDGSTPIVNHPEAAMLGVGRIVRKPWVVGDGLAVRDVVQLSLTFDHRVCDGGTAGGFLRHVADCVEHPGELLRTLRG